MILFKTANLVNNWVNRTDNCPEFPSNVFQEFCETNSIRHIRIQKGKPKQNAYIKRLNKSIRSGVMDASLFENIEQLRTCLEEWEEDYNDNHPHSSLTDYSPREF